jgi:hypothetical protein
VAALAAATVMVPGFVLHLSAARAGKIPSMWSDHEIKIDGTNTEWGALSLFSKDSQLFVGVKNDADFAYVVLATSDAATKQQVVRQGLIVWFDGEGGTKKRFGIEYPVPAPAGARQGGYGRGSRPGGGYGGGQDPGEQGGRGPGDDGRDGYGPSRGDGDPNDLLAQAENDGRLKDLQILGPGKDDRFSMRVETAMPIEAKFGSAEGTLLYELKVPLVKRSGTECAVGVKPGAVLGIGLETPERESDRNRVQPTFGGVGGRGDFGGRGGVGGRGGFGGGRRGNGGGYGGGAGGLQATKPLGAWTSVQLAQLPK